MKTKTTIKCFPPPPCNPQSFPITAAERQGAVFSTQMLAKYLSVKWGIPLPEGRAGPAKETAEPKPLPSGGEKLAADGEWPAEPSPAPPVLPVAPEAAPSAAPPPVQPPLPPAEPAIEEVQPDEDTTNLIELPKRRIGRGPAQFPQGLNAPESSELRRLTASFGFERLAEQGGLIPYFNTVPPGIRVPGDTEPFQQTAAAQIHREMILDLIEGNPGLFDALGSSSISIWGATVRFGSPLRLEDYDAIPTYLTLGAHTTLLFAYRSKSQASWRRFAGKALGIFWKGGSEHLQNFDWRIQKELDGIYYISKEGASLRKPDGGLLRLSELGLSSPLLSDRTAAEGLVMITSGEEAIQESMCAGRKHFDIADKGNEPELLLDYWWAGRPDEAYGIHLNLIVASRNRDYAYCIAITDEGLFPKYMQDARFTLVNPVGAPAVGVPLYESHKWLLTPIVEYTRQQAGVVEETGDKVQVHDTVIFGDRRVRILGAHTSDRSPFFRLSNGLADFYLLLRSESYESAERKLQKIIADGGYLPLSAIPPKEVEVPEREAQDRHQQLIEAYYAFQEGSLDSSTDSGRTKMAEMLITERELSVFRRYNEYLRAWKNGSGGDDIPLLVRQRLMKRLGWMARQWAKDMNEDTVIISLR